MKDDRKGCKESRIIAKNILASKTVIEKGLKQKVRTGKTSRSYAAESGDLKTTNQKIFQNYQRFHIILGDPPW